MNRLVLPAVLLVSLSLAPSCCADEIAQKGREIVSKYKDAVLIVRMVIKGGMSFHGMGSHQEESKSEATGVVIDPSGLTVVPLSETDPYGELGDLLSSLKSRSDMDIHFKSELADVKMVLSDGKEIPGKVVLRDRDLDLAFVRPGEKPSEAMTFIDLSKDVELDLLDEAVCLDRMTSAYDRVPHIALGRVKSIVEKPRKYYLVEGTTSGAPVFDLEGKVLGINLSTPNDSSEDEESILEMMRGSGNMVLPAADIREAAAQAPEVDQVREEEPEGESESSDAVEGATEEN